MQSVGFPQQPILVRAMAPNCIVSGTPKAYDLMRQTNPGAAETGKAPHHSSPHPFIRQPLLRIAEFQEKSSEHNHSKRWRQDFL